MTYNLDDALSELEKHLGNSKKTIEILGNLSDGVVIPEAALRKSLDSMSTTVDGTTSGILYSGWITEDFHSGKAAEDVALENGKVARINDTDAYKLLNSEEFELAYKKANPKDFAVLFDTDRTLRTGPNSLWDHISRKFAAGLSGDVMTVTPNADARRVFAQTELPTLLENPKVKRINGVDKVVYSGRYLELTAKGMSPEDAIAKVHNDLVKPSSLDYVKVSSQEAADLIGITPAHDFKKAAKQSSLGVEYGMKANPSKYETSLRVLKYDGKTILSGMDTVEALSTKTAKLKNWLHLGSLSKKGIVTAAVGSAVCVALTRTALANQRELAETARDLPSTNRKHLSGEQYDDYTALLNKMEPRMMAEAADPFLVTGVIQTSTLEADLYAGYQEYLAKYPTLDPELAKSLEPGMVHNETVVETLRDRTLAVMQNDPDNIPNSMQTFAKAFSEGQDAQMAFEKSVSEVMVKAQLGANQALVQDLISEDPQVQQAAMRFNQSMETIQNTFQETLGTADGAHFIVSQLSDQELLNLVERTARFDPSLDETSELKAYSAYSAQEGILLKQIDCIGSSPEETMQCHAFVAHKKELAHGLLDNPSAMRGYLVDRFVPAENQPSSLINMSGEQISRIERSEDYITMAIPLENMKAGIANDPTQQTALKFTVANADFFPQDKNLQNAMQLAESRFPEQVGVVRADIAEQMDAYARQHQFEQEQLEAQRRAFEQQQAPEDANTKSLLAMGVR